MERRTKFAVTVVMTSHLTALFTGIQNKEG